MRAILTASIFLVCVQIQAISIQFVTNPDACGYGNGYVWAIASQGVPPYTYLWSNGATTNTMHGLEGGVYSVLITDALGDTVSGSVEVMSLQAPLYDNIAKSSACSGECNGEISIYPGNSGGVSPFTCTYAQVGGNTITLPPNDGSTRINIEGLCDGLDVWVSISDGNGCTATFTVPFPAATIYPAPPITTRDACAGNNNGEALINFDGWYFADLITLVLIGPGPQDTVFNSWAGYPSPIGGLAPGDYSVHIIPPTFGCTPTSYFTIGSQPDCGAITGTAFVDLDQDCTPGPNDLVLAYRPLVMQPGNIVRLTNANGSFNIPLEYGSYTLEQADPDLCQLCPTSAPYSFDLNASDPVHTVQLADSVIGGIYLGTHFANSWAIPGFVQTNWITITNHSPYPTGPITLSFDHETIFSYVNSSEVPVSTSAGNVVWEFAGLGSFGSYQFNLQLQVPADPTLIGTIHSATATVTSGSEIFSATNDFMVVGAYDPNDITAKTTGGSSDSYFLASDGPIEYTIRFQNTGNFLAQNIYIVDTLSELLDMTRFEVLGASHNFSAAYLEDRTLRFDFPNIQLPDSTNDEPNSHGYIAYRIAPIPGLVVGDVIENTAGIYFDFNPAVITNTSVVTVETPQAINEHVYGDLRAIPNPASTNVRLMNNGKQIAIVQGRIISADGRVHPLAGPDLRNGLINVAQLATGVYILDLTDVSGMRMRLRLVKE